MTEDTDAFERVPPQDLHAEAGALGGMLLSKDAIPDVHQHISRRSYYHQAHGLIHDAILDLWRKGQPADPITVTAYLTERGDIVRVGGPGTLHSIVNSVPTAANAEYYAEIVRERHIQRELIETGTRLVQRGYDTENPEDTLDAAVAELQHLTQQLRRTSASRERTLDEMLEEYLEDLETGVTDTLPLPYQDLEEVLKPEPGDFIVVAARPAVGKTVVLLDIARNVGIKHKMRARVASMEMSHKQLTQRILAAEARVGLHKIRHRITTAEDDRSIRAAIARMTGSPLVVDDSPAVPLSKLRGRLRQLAALDQVPAVLCVDYLQIMKAEAAAGSNRTGEVDSLARGLKELAQEFRMVVIAAAQLNRQVEQRPDKTPTMADLRESGQIEAEANSIVLLYREEVYDKETPRAGELDLIVAKNRQGPTAKITVAFKSYLATAIDMGSKD
jgi:replicative DNA helicase